MSENRKAAGKEIPGFYYDEEKKKYFRITKDHPKPAKKAANVKRKMTIERQPESTHLPLFKIIGNREIDATCVQKFRRKIKQSSIKSMDLMNSNAMKLHLEEANLTFPTQKVDILKIIPSAKQDILAILSKIKGFDYCLLQIYDVKFNNDRQMEMTNAYNISIGKITDTVFSNERRHFTNGLLISSLNESLGCYQAIIYWIDDFLVSDRVVKIRKGQCIWSSCFIHDRATERRFALGLSNGISLVGPDNRTENQLFIPTSRSNVLALDCGKRAGYLYSGSRDGYIRCLDLRSLSITASAKAKKSIDNVKLLRSETHLVVSTMAGHLELWDIRMLKPVLSYVGHCNSHSLLSIHLDENEDFLAAVGEDCVARIWDVRTTERIREIPSIRFDDVGDPIRPEVTFLDKITGPGISCGFLYGIGDELFHYYL